MCALAGAVIGTPLVATSAAAAAIIENLSIFVPLEHVSPYQRLRLHMFPSEEGLRQGVRHAGRAAAFSEWLFRLAHKRSKIRFAPGQFPA
jgi:hypothetical protein